MPASWWEAAKRGDVDLLRLLLENGHEVDTQDANGLTALHLAALHNRVEAAVLLLEHGANPSHAEARWGGTPLHRAAINGDAKVAEALLEARAQPAARYPGNGWTPLHEAAMHGHAPVARLLLDFGAPRDAQTKQGETPFVLAAKQRHTATAGVLHAWQPHGQRSGLAAPTATVAAESAAVLREDMGVLGALLLAAMLPVVVSRLCSLPRRQPWLLA